MTEETDYNVKVSVRNGRLLSRIKAAGYPTVAAFARANNLSPGSVQLFITLRASGMKSAGDRWKSLVIEMADALNCMPDDIIPEQHKFAKLSRNTFELEMTGQQAAELIGQSQGHGADHKLIQDEARRILNVKLAKLPARMERIVRMRTGFNDEGRVYTLDETAEAMGFVTRERVRQIEFKAMEKLQGKDRKARAVLRSYIGDLASDD